MSKKVSRRLVIDASVARASGGEAATFPTSKQCRDFLAAVLDICHRVALSREVLDEWKKHQSRFARKWLRSMFAHRKVESPDQIEDEQLRAKIQCAAKSERNRAAMLKDVCLVEAALVTDGVVVSLDDTVRRLFHEIAGQVGELGPVVWVNPSAEEEDAIGWLERGALPERKRSLGALRISDA